MPRSFKGFLFCFLWLIPLAGHALSHIVQYQDLVAGTGNYGFEDGSFSSAQFNTPLGLVLNEDASILYVADQGNNRIRAIHLDQKNWVETVAGTGVAGKKDGPISTATFNYPSGVAVIPGGQIVVNDAANGLLRLIDLKTKEVSTLAGGGTGIEGDPLKVGLSWVRSIVFFSSDNSLYFSQPDNGLLSKLDLKTNRIVKILFRNPLVPQPAALCVTNHKLYVADLKMPQVYEVQFNSEKKETHPSQTTTPGFAPASSSPISLALVGQGDNILAMAGSGENLYACQASKDPVCRIFPDAAPLTFASVWGWGMTYPGSLFPQFGFANNDIIGFVADPHIEKRFFLANPHSPAIYAFRDMGFNGEKITAGEASINDTRLHDLNYPFKKPPKTFRILLIGKSYLFWQADERQFQQPGFMGENQNTLSTLAKKMELELNTRAALEDVPWHFEVINGGRHENYNEINIWPYYVVPDIVRKYDIDLAIVMMDPGIIFQSFFYCPFTSEGIPVDKVDPEYALIPPSEKFKTGPMHDFFEILRKQKLLGKQPGADPWTFDMDEVIMNPVGEEALIELLGRPLRLLKQKLETIKNDNGVHCRLEFCYFPITPPSRSPKDRGTFWRDFCREAGIPFMDLEDDFTALGTTYYPYAGPDMGHFTPNGMSLFSTIMVHELISNHKIPFNASKP